eukprot:13177844-Ditylum_brightwellii.AAC.1
MEWSIERYVDNEGLIKCVDTQLTYPHDYPSNTLECDWDLVKHIATTMQQFHHLPTVSHIKGHKDDKNVYEDIDWKSQQNADADWLAGQYIKLNNVH